MRPKLSDYVSDVLNGFASGQRDDSGVIQLRMNNVLPGGGIDLSTFLKVPCSDVQRKNYLLQLGDILFNNTNSTDMVGKTGLFQGHDEPVVFSNHFTRIRVDPKKADPSYFAYFLNYLWWKGVFRDLCQRWIGQSAIKFSVLADLAAPFPDPNTQRQIASRLKEQMAVVEAARKAVEAQREGLNALISAEIRVGISQPETRIRLVGDVMEEVSQGVGSAWADFPVLGATRNGIAAAKEPVGKNPQRYKPVIPGTVFYNPMRIMIGSIAMLDEGDGAGITSPDYVALRPRDGSVRSLWFYCWLRSAFGAAFISSLARGAVRERMLFSRLREGEMPVPPDHWQSHFQGLARHIRKAIAVLDEQAEAIEKLPAAYLRAAFGGIE